jgi:pyruvate formate lyase activating enzyme
VKKADFYEQLDDKRVLCTLCPHNCRLDAGEYGTCAVRQNIDGDLVSHVYERAIATHIDPIEKKPLFHVFPGSSSFSVATVGCNFTCTFCQNHQISQMPHTGQIEGQHLPAKEVVQLAKARDCKTIACTYTEPTIYFEYAYDIARLAAEQDIKTVFVSNGFINPKPLQKIAPFLSAANIDLKGWDDDFYRNVCGGDFMPVLNTLKLMKKLNIFIEVTTLAVTGFVDDESVLRDIARFIKNELGPETPWHISRFFPQYHYASAPPTPPEVLQRAREIGLDEGLRYVYIGNIMDGGGENTNCYSCGERLIHRSGYQILSNKILNNKCPACDVVIDGIGMSGDEK